MWFLRRTVVTLINSGTAANREPHNSSRTIFVMPTGFCGKSLECRFNRKCNLIRKSQFMLCVSAVRWRGSWRKHYGLCKFWRFPSVTIEDSCLCLATLRHCLSGSPTSFFETSVTTYSATYPDITENQRQRYYFFHGLTVDVNLRRTADVLTWRRKVQRAADKDWKWMQEIGREKVLVREWVKERKRRGKGWRFGRYYFNRDAKPARKTTRYYQMVGYPEILNKKVLLSCKLGVGVGVENCMS